MYLEQLKKLWITSKSLFECTRFRLGCNASTKLIIDPDMYKFFEEGTRGGVSHISNRYNKANNKYLKCYDPKQEPKHIIYLDANNLNNYAMSRFLPTTG